MAKLRAFTPINMATMDVWYGNVLENTGTRITVTDGFNSISYVGRFSYNYEGDPFGTLTGIIGWRGSKKVYDISGVKADVSTLGFLVGIGDVDQILAEVFWRADLMLGSGGRDVLWGFQGADQIHGYGGKDFLWGGPGKDILYGGAGDDVLVGDTHNDRLFGGGGSDGLLGGGGSDKLFGGQGSDLLEGEGGDDKLDGGRGRDGLIGGRGSDFFVFREGYGVDRVKDFKDDVDTIRLDDGLWRGSLSKAEVIDRFASVKNGNVVFDFGDDKLVIKNFEDLTELRDDLQIV